VQVSTMPDDLASAALADIDGWEKREPAAVR
jgi:hypothetical protein